MPTFYCNSLSPGDRETSTMRSSDPTRPWKTKFIIIIVDHIQTKIRWRNLILKLLLQHLMDQLHVMSSHSLVALYKEDWLGGTYWELTVKHPTMSSHLNYDPCYTKKPHSHPWSTSKWTKMHMMDLLTCGRDLQPCGRVHWLFTIVTDLIFELIPQFIHL